MKIVVGKKYVARNGEVYEVLYKHDKMFFCASGLELCIYNELGVAQTSTVCCDDSYLDGLELCKEYDPYAGLKVGDIIECQYLRGSIHLRYYAGDGRTVIQRDNLQNASAGAPLNSFNYWKKIEVK